MVDRTTTEPASLQEEAERARITRIAPEVTQAERKARAGIGRARQREIAKAEAQARAKRLGGTAVYTKEVGWYVKDIGTKPIIGAPPKLPTPPPPPAPPVDVPLEVTPLEAEEREFTLPPDVPRKDITYTARGKVEYYEKAGERFYAPASTMWDLGFKTKTQYIESQKGMALPFVPIKTADRGVVHITQPEAIKLSKLKDEDLHHAWISLGIIPKGTLYIAPAMVEKATKALKPYKLLDKKYDLYRAIEDKVSPAYLDIMFGKPIVARARADKGEYDEALKAMSDYKRLPTSEEFARGMIPRGYNLYEATEAGVKRKYRILLFGEEAVKEYEGMVKKGKEISLAEKAPTLSVFQATASGKKFESKHPEFAKVIIGITQSADPMDLSEHYGGWIDAWYSARDKLGEDKVPTLKEYTASLQSQMREYKNRIMSLPKDSRKRQLFQEELVRRGITAVAYVATLAIPYTFGAIGVVGTRIVSKVVPATIRSIPLLGKIPQAAVILAQYTSAATPIAYTGATISEAVQTADLERKWQTFLELAPAKQDAWAKRVGYDNFQALSDSEKANVLLHYAVPPEYSLGQWSSTLAKHTEDLIEHSQKGSAWLHEHLPKQVSIPVSFAGGTIAGAVIEAPSYMLQIPLIAAGIVDRVPSGTAKEFATTVAVGMAAFFTTVLPAALRADPSLASGRIVGLFVLSPPAAVKLVKGGFAGFKPSYIPERTVGTEFTTLRVEFTQIQIRNVLKMSPAELKALGSNITATLLAGKNFVKGFGNLQLKVETVPYQKVVGNALFHFTPDITKFKVVEQMPIVGKLYTSPQAAVRAGIAALVKGEKATHPGLVEVRVPEGFTIKGASIEKLIGRGKTIEIEAPLKGALDPIPGWQGKGISANAYFGSYPIRRFTLQGVDTPIVKLTPAKLAKLRAMAFTESIADVFQGWHGRMQALKREVATNKKLTQTLKDISTGISQLKKGKVETIGKHGEITSQRQPIPHPTRSGEIKPRVTVIVRNSKGEIMMVMDRSEASYGLPGGQIDLKWRKGQLGWTRLADGRRVLKPAGAAHGQIKSETGVGLTKTKFLNTYIGKVTEHAFSGSRVYEALAKTEKIDISVSKGEIKAALWWNGKTEITVYPATYDILLSVARKYNLDMSKVKIDVSRPILNRTRDTSFASRVAKGEKLTLSQIKNVNNIEIASLRELRNEISNPSLWDYIKSEGDFALLSELIKGRRPAVKWQEAVKKPLSIVELKGLIDGIVLHFAKMIKLVKSMSETEVKSQYGISKAKLLKRFDTQKLERAKTLEAQQREVKRLAKEQADLANKRLSQEDVRSYVRQGEYLTRRYTSYFDRAIRAIGSGIRIRKIPLELVQYRPTMAEIRREYRTTTYPLRRPTPLRIDYPIVSRAREEIYREPYRVIETREPTRPPYYPPYKPPRPPRPPRPRPPRPPRYPPKELPPPPPRLLVRAISDSPARQPVEQGSIAFAFGERKGARGIRVPQWYYIPPPYTMRKPISIPYPPLGAVRADSVKPGETIQVIGRSRRYSVPASISIDVGVTDAFITEYGRKITFGGEGERTDVGTRMPSPTKGMDIPATEPLFFTDDLLTDLPKQGINRPSMSKKKPSRKVRRDDDFSDLTSVRGMRY